MPGRKAKAVILHQISRDGGTQTGEAGHKVAGRLMQSRDGAGRKLAQSAKGKRTPHCAKGLHIIAVP